MKSSIDGKGASLTLVRTTNGRIFGGFTSINLCSTDKYNFDIKSFIFSVNLMQKYPILKNFEFAVFTSYYYIGFGSGHDLQIYSLIIHRDSNNNK